MADSCQPALPMGLCRSEHDHGDTEFSPSQVAERERLAIALKTASPLRGRAVQHDASDLGLFRAADEQELPL